MRRNEYEMIKQATIDGVAEWICRMALCIIVGIGLCKLGAFLFL